MMAAMASVPQRMVLVAVVGAQVLVVPMLLVQ
jgi:hypothetical protein